VGADGANGPFSHQRRSLADPDDPDGELVYKLKTRWSYGAEDRKDATYKPTPSWPRNFSQDSLMKRGRFLT
jgi:hypothetical protein